MISKFILHSSLLLAVLLQGSLQAGSPKGIPDLAAVVTPTLNDQVELWQPGGSSPHDHNMTLGQLNDWLKLSPQLGGFFVPQTFTINGHALSGNVAVAYSDLTGLPSLFGGAFADLTSKPTTLSGYGITNGVANTITVNGHALSGNVTVAYSDLTGLPTLGTSAAKDIPATGNASSSQVVYGTDTRLADARTPAAHATSHKSGGGDAVKLDELASPTDVTTLNATTGVHGLLPKLGGGTTNFLRADGTWNAPAGGGGSLTNPHVFYVRSDGNDSSPGDGTPSHPFATAQKAYDTGVTAAVPFVLDLGVGSFTITLTADWSSYAKAVRGAGGTFITSTSPTVLTVTGNASPATTTDNQGAPGNSIPALNLSGLYFLMTSTGQNVTADDGNTYTAGPSGNVILSGSNAWVSVTLISGGDQGSSLGVVNSGGAGNVTLTGNLSNGADGINLSDAAVYNGGIAGGPGAITADGCDLRTGGVTNGPTITLGRCSYGSGLGFTDKGGNAAY